VATIRFIGPTQFAGGEWIGCELDDATGKNDGSVQGERYFQCKSGYGIFVRESMVRKEGVRRKPAERVGSGGNAKAPRQSASVVESDEATELRVQLAEAAEEHDTERLRELLPKAESSGVPKMELVCAQRVLDFQVKMQAKDLEGSLLTELEDVRVAVAKLADVVANVEARAAAVERAVLTRSGAEAEGSAEEVSPGIDSLMFDTALMDNWIKDFGMQLQERVWETLERDIETALEKAVEKATQGLSSLSSASPESPPVSDTAPVSPPLVLDATRVSDNHPGQVIGNVCFQMNIENMDYAKLMKNKSLVASLEASVKKSMIADLGNTISEADIDLTLREGSVIVDAKARLPPGTTWQDAQAKLDAPESSMRTLVCKEIAAMDGIAEVVTGEIAVGSVLCKVEAKLLETERPARPAEVFKDDQERARMAARIATLEAKLAARERQAADALRDRAAGTLLDAERSGNLEKLLSGGHTSSDVERVRERAKATMMHAERSGKLEKIMEDKKGNAGKTSEVERVRQRAKASMLEAERSGKLENIMKDKKGNAGKTSEVERVRQRAKASMLEAERSGKLENIMKDKKGNAGKTSEVERVRERAKATMVNAESSGKLQKIMKDKSGKSGKTSDVEKVRARAQVAMVNAERSGTLEKIVKDKKGKFAGALPLMAQSCPQAVGIEGCLLTSAALTMPALLF